MYQLLHFTKTLTKKMILFAMVITCSAYLTEGTKYSETEIADILTAHNQFRSNVTPPATNMIELQWSPELEQVASDHAEKCDWNHNPDRKSQQDVFPSVGENIFVSSAKIVPATKAVEAWHNEVQYYTYSNHSCSKVCGHYTQVVWASTTHVGCAYAKCATMSEGDNPERFKDVIFVVCNYGPAGNMRGQQPYSTGSWCSNCPADTSCVNNLCSSISSETNDGVNDSAESAGDENTENTGTGDTEPEETGLESGEPEANGAASESTGESEGEGATSEGTGESRGEGAGSEGEGAGSEGEGAGSEGEGAGSEGEGAVSEGESAGSEGESAGSEGEGAGSEGEGAGSEGEGAGSEGEGAGSEGEGAESEGEGAGSEGEGAESEGEGAGSEGEGVGSEGTGETEGEGAEIKGPMARSGGKNGESGGTENCKDKDKRCARLFETKKNFCDKKFGKKKCKKTCNKC